MILAEKQRISEILYSTSEKPRNFRRGNLKPMVGMISIFLCLLLVNLWIQVIVVKRNHEIKDCRDAIRTLERESIQVRVEMAKLESFDRIQTIARKELGMRVAGPSDYRCIAAAPTLNKDIPRPYNYSAKSTPQNNRLWAQLASWFEGIRTVMAQTP